ncbi:glycosyltransferase family 4 protein [Tepidibacter formicigenes]|jgi:UDP-GlcNAc:undecaprenyl-phosphate GlcNAc-1-phosphate transferase|uniref:UDP-GlcNAc:undecaprenyl-phosphate GlcNAc-1-phosphate transferase n=1 Tax=Tepidibacter formicigenes DSM 15518 TaxID=1123349 RepID=A0A1M6MR13_9FIRM|nr:MraY family glycosyltransferase [Tepidibacter formicigenes]SHJ85723.1 UDP-GlcNAc:undecaprenyl-phosphate GlcNAc-1-phosphate transferase [Tepidibacter formicigenes DSM 15518]
MDKMIIALVLSFGISYFSTPLAIKLAHKIGAIDIPKDSRRVHKNPIPRLGGIAIFLGFFITSIFLVKIDIKMIGILLGAALIVGMGIIDDTRDIKPKTKLLGQIVAAVIVVICGVKIEFITNPFIRGISYLGILGIPITIFWIVGITNTVNLIDGLDGLAAGVSAISAITISFVAYISGQEISGILLLALAGGALGFLPYNFNPAKIFMGDTGSLFLGYILSVIAIEGAIKSAAALAIAIPILALGLPIFDTTFAIVRRKLNGKPIMQADKGHLHHRLLNKGLSQKQTVLILYAISLFLGLSAVLISESSLFEAVLILTLDVVFIYYGIIRLKLLSVDETEVE